MSAEALRQLADTPWNTRLWLVDLDRCPDAPPGLLDADENTRASRFVFDIDRRRYRAAHSALRQVLAAETGMAPGATYEHGPHGKPQLAAPAGAAFNLSHSAQWALIGVRAQGEIGVDLEVLRPIQDLETLAQEHFTEPEMQALHACADDHAALRAFLSGWTRKEACLKACGSGLSIAPRSFDAGLAPGPTRVRVQAEDGAEFMIDVTSLTLAENILGAVATVNNRVPPTQAR